MPPSYKELPVQIPQGVIGDTFNQKAIDFTDAEKIQAALRAQELNNQAVQLSVDARQRQADQEKELRDALIAQYGANAQTDPNAPIDPSANNYDPIEGYKLAQQIAMQHGDLAAATTAARTQKLLENDNNNDDNRLLSPDEIISYKQQGLDLPAGATTKDVKLQIAVRNSTSLANRIDIYGKNHDLNTNKFGYQKEKDTNAPGIFDPIIGEDGKPKIVTPPMQKILSGLEPAAGTIIRNGDDLIKRLQSDPVAIGDPQAAQEQAIANMLPALRAIDNQGVRFNQFIRDIDINQMGPGGDAAIAHRIASVFIGQDPAAAMDRFVREITQQIQERAHANNGAVNPDKLAAFDPKLPELWNEYGMFDRGGNDISGAMGRSGAGTAGTPEVAGSGTLPRNADGSPLSREQFMALRNKGN